MIPSGTPAAIVRIQEADRKVIQKYEKEDDRYDKDDHHTDGREFHAIYISLIDLKLICSSGV